MGGKKPFALADEAEWIRARLAEKPDITGRELLAELIRRGVTVSYYGVWHFLDHIGLSFKKKPARQRTGSRRRGPPAQAVETTTRQNLCHAAGVRR
jgi:transposase